MATFEHIDYTDYISDYSIKNGQLATEVLINSGTLKLKKEINNLYNVIAILNDTNAIPWREVELYSVGDIVQNVTGDNQYYRARRKNISKRPDLFSDDWDIVTIDDVTNIGNFKNYLAKDNMIEYIPTDPYNPSTKKYVDLELGKKLGVSERAFDSNMLNGETVKNVLSTSISAPASIGIVNSVNNKVDTKLNIDDFNSTEILTKLKEVDGAGSGLDADLLDGKGSSRYMHVSNTEDVNILKVPGSYIADIGTPGLPTDSSTYTILVSGDEGQIGQIATDIVSNELYYRSYNTEWSPWASFATSEGNVATADQWSSTISLTLTDDATGTVSFDGSTNVNLSVNITNDSHTHDTRYYTESECDDKFLHTDDTALNAEKFNTFTTDQFIRSDADQITSGNYTWNGIQTFIDNVTMDKNLNITEDITVGGNGIFNGDILQTASNLLELGTADDSTDTTADMGGIILHGSTDKSILWNYSTDTWDFSTSIKANEFIGNATNSYLLENLSSSQFLRSDIDTTKENKLTINKNVGTDTDYTTGQFEISNTDGGDASIGFNRIGYSGCQLRHEENGLILSGITSDASADLRVTGEISSDNADLAEKYTIKTNESPGTIMSIHTDESSEITKCLKDMIPFGIVSDKPGFILNKEIDGLPIALTGKTPVRILGPITKGNPITIDDNGIGKECDYNTPYHLIIGKALETNLEPTEKLVICSVSI